MQYCGVSIMTIGEKIKIARDLRGYTQKQLGFMTGLNDSRIRQYELNIRTPKESQLQIIADALGMPIEFFCAKGIDSDNEIMHALFELEMGKGISIDSKEGAVSISFQDNTLNEFIKEWSLMKRAFDEGSISKEEYDLWKARFPLSVADQHHERLRVLRESEK